MSAKNSLLEQLTIDRSKDGQNSNSKGLIMLMVIIGIVLLTIILMLWVQLQTHKEKLDAVAEQPAIVQVANQTESPPILQVSDRSNIALSASGYVVARRVATISSEITGLIKEVLIEEGLMVEAGQVLARLDDAHMQVNLRLAEQRVEVNKIAIATIKLNVAEAKRILKREKSINEKGYSNKANLTRAQTNVDVLNKDLNNAQIALRIADLEVKQQIELVNDTIVTAPFTGIVVNKAAQAGEIISPVSAGGGFTRTGICTLVDMNSLEIEVDVNEAYIDRVKQNQLVKATLDAYPDWEIDARVIAIIPTANRSKATVRVRIAIEDLTQHNKDGNFRILPEMSIKVDFLTN